MTSSEIGPIQHKLQITLSENQLNKLADITGSLPRHRKILPYPLVISLLTALGKDSNAETLQDIYRKFNALPGRRSKLLNFHRAGRKKHSSVLGVGFCCLIISFSTSSLSNLSDIGCQHHTNRGANDHIK